MVNTNFVVELHITMGTAEPAVLARVTAQSPERAAQMVRLQARPFAGLQLEDAPIWQWIKVGYRQAVAELAAGTSVTVGFSTDEGRVEWRVQPVLAAQSEQSN
ncbi:hypothetical protein EDD99_8142 [Streptomyces sp. 846.5]|nr:hypothetical protein [Streptomyces sp. 846.5]TDT93333.1 hypothetical protein EDD99_8142 [Streptomyces sp. 846.5]